MKMYYLIIKELLIYFTHKFKERCLNSSIKNINLKVLNVL